MSSSIFNTNTVSDNQLGSSWSSYSIYNAHGMPGDQVNEPHTTRTDMLTDKRDASWPNTSSNVTLAADQSHSTTQTAMVSGWQVRGEDACMDGSMNGTSMANGSALHGHALWAYHHPQPNRQVRLADSRHCSQYNDISSDKALPVLDNRCDLQPAIHYPIHCPHQFMSTSQVPAAPFLSGRTMEELLIPKPTRFLDLTELGDHKSSDVAQDLSPSAFVKPLDPPLLPKSRNAAATSVLACADDLNEAMDKGSCRHIRKLSPRVSYLEMVGTALISVPDCTLPLAKIYDYMLQYFVHLRSLSSKSWKNSVRHVLSSQPCFVRQPVPARLHAWSVHRANIDDFKKGHFNSSLAKKRMKEFNDVSAHVR